MAPPSTTWEIAQCLGLCAVAGCLVLCVLAVRPRTGSASALLLRDHELLGWLVLTAAVVHVGLSLAADHRVIEHLKLTAPRYEYAGVIALLMLLFLTVPATAVIRRRLWGHHRNFQAMHVSATCLLVVALAVHVITTSRYVNGRQRVVIYVLLSSIVLLALLRPRNWRGPPNGYLGRLVFGRHAQLVLAVVLGSLLALLALTRDGTPLLMREPFVRRSVPLVLDFPHDRHRMVNCVACHHNFVDQSGADSCISCHRSGRTDLLVGVEARFHDFCLSCHRNPPAYLTGHGPVTGCSTCHAPLSSGRTAMTAADGSSLRERSQPVTY